MKPCTKEGDHLIIFLVVKFVYAYDHTTIMKFSPNQTTSTQGLFVSSLASSIIALQSFQLHMHATQVHQHATLPILPFPVWPG